jgi:hypothetical protein
LEQRGHEYGFSPVWTEKCLATLHAFFDLYPHTPQNASGLDVFVDVPLQTDGNRHSTTV